MLLSKKKLKSLYIKLHSIIFPMLPNYFEKKLINRHKKMANSTHEDVKNAIIEQFKRVHNYELNLDNPQTFQEKIAWLKLYYQKPLITFCANKCTAQQYVQEKINCSDKLFVKQLGVYNSIDEIDFSDFPKSFVLKSNWGSGKQIIVQDINSINERKLRSSMKNWLCEYMNHYYESFEYGYKNIEPKILCEDFLEFEYKIEFFCFNGKPEFFWLVFDDKTDQTSASLFNLDWEKLPFRHGYPHIKHNVSKPEFFEQILELAKQLCVDFPFVRVDFYKTKDGFKFSELTFYPWAGLIALDPPEFEKVVGDMLTLPSEKIIE